MKVSSLPLQALHGTLLCDCGQQHSLSTQLAAVCDDAPARLAEALTAQSFAGRVLLLCDPTTFDVLGRRAEGALRAALPVDVCLLRGENLHADEEALGTAMLAVQDDTARIVACGSGTVNDVARYLAARVRLPYDVLGTAPSMDGYTSSVSPLLQRGFKITFPAAAPQHALLDLPSMCAAPQPMVAAGLGDLLGKLTALADWRLGHEVYGESHCGEIEALMRRAVDSCAVQAAALARRGADAVTALGEGLLLSGLAMQMVGTSRPASGCEHHLAHFWEMRQLARGERPTLHGDKVGYAELLMLSYYAHFFAMPRPFGVVDMAAWSRGMMAAFGPLAQEVLASSVPDGAPSAAVRERALAKWDMLAANAAAITSQRETLAAHLRACGGPTTHIELGLSVDDVRDALYYAKEIRPRPTVMRLAFAWGVHTEICDEIVEELV